MACAFIFPGQGSQKVGMAAAFVNGFRAGIDIMEEVEDAISFKISKLIEEGPIEELTKTENAQPAIFAVSMACIAVLEKEFGYNIAKNVKYLTGHSLGEYTALCTAGVFSIHDAAKLVRARGEIMEKVCSKNNSEYAMVALLGIGVEDVENLVRPFQSGRHICVIANDNSQSQVVISGHKSAVRIVCEEAKKIGVDKAMELNTSGPFHSPLMVEAAIEFDKIIATSIEFKDFKVPVVMNITAQPLDRKEEVHNLLVRHMTGRVRWREISEFLVNNSEIEKIVEIGPGKLLSLMMKRSIPEANVFNIATVSQMEEFIKLNS